MLVSKEFTYMCLSFAIAKLVQIKHVKLVTIFSGLSTTLPYPLNSEKWDLYGNLMTKPMLWDNKISLTLLLIF